MTAAPTGRCVGVVHEPTSRAAAALHGAGRPMHDSGEHLCFTCDVLVMCTAQKLFDFVRNPLNIERWTEVFRDVQPFRGDIYQFQQDYLGHQPITQGYFEIHSHADTRCVDFLWGDRPGDYWGFAGSRIVPFANASLYILSIFREKTKLANDYLHSSEVIDRELRTLKGLLEGGCEHKR